MSDLIFYTNPRSRGRVARFMLEEVGADYERIVLDYGPPMKDPRYLAVNPMGKVPTLVHGDTVVSEGAAICAYLADAFPAAGLAPPPEARGAYYRWLFFAAGPLEAAVTARGLKMEPAPEKSMQVGYGSVDLVVDTLDRVLAEREWVASDRFSAADVYLGSSITWGLAFGILPARASLERYAERVQARPAFQRAAKLDDADVPDEPATP